MENPSDKILEPTKQDPRMGNPTLDEAKNGDIGHYYNFCKGAKLRRMKRVEILIKTIEILKEKLAFLLWKCEVYRKALQLLQIENERLKSETLEVEHMLKLTTAECEMLSVEKKKLIEQQPINWDSEPSDAEVIDNKPHQG
ncbi:glycosyltransferase family 1 protein [Sesbania bispinosa]|nr:glycosyltransferase family 1 protein [Sesbania bispinosa]